MYYQNTQFIIYIIIHQILILDRQLEQYPATSVG
jgi:hypothetical protein